MILQEETSQFRQELLRILRGNDPRQLDEEALLREQRLQIERIVALEAEFRLALRRSGRANRVYTLFLRFVRKRLGGILFARPFFRERQRYFSAVVVPILEKDNIRALETLALNFRFVRFALAASRLPESSELARIAEDLFSTVDVATTRLLFLVANQAAMFSERTPPAHLTPRDLISIGAEGLMEALGKFTPPFSRVFRSVAIGRMLGRFIEDYSSPSLHFYPNDRRHLYRLNKLLSNADWMLKSTSELATEINRIANEKELERLSKGGAPRKQVVEQIDEAHLGCLMAASTTVSLDAPMGGGEDDDREEDRAQISSVVADSDDARPDVQLEKKRQREAVLTAASRLPLLARKLLVLRGLLSEEVLYVA